MGREPSAGMTEKDRGSAPALHPWQSASGPRELPEQRRLVAACPA